MTRPLAVSRGISGCVDGTERDKSHHIPGGRGFANPWPSWSKPSLYDFWSGLSWANQDGASGRNKGDEDESSTAASEQGWDSPLLVEKPDFNGASHSQHASKAVRTWWLGHAGVLVEFPSEEENDESEEGTFRVLFDPIFSQRCSPSQYAGPVRFVPSPVSVADLPPVHLLVISHNHYDHLDAQTVTELWDANAPHLRIAVPLGNLSWLMSLLGPQIASRVTEMDWWDEATFWQSPGEGSEGGTPDEFDSESSQSEIDKGDGSEEGDQTSLPDDCPSLRLICNPSQHGSGRFGLDAGTSLWASYTLLYRSSRQRSRPDFHLYFAGDTGYRLRPPHIDPEHPKLPPACPAFQDIHDAFGAPDLLLMPISVGSAYSYIKSWDPVGILPQVDGGLTAQNHLDEWEAVEVSRILTGQKRVGAPTADGEKPSTPRDDHTEGASTLRPHRRRPLAIAIHFGTFSPPSETQGNLQRLREACERQGWRPLRTVPSHRVYDEDESEGDFLVLNHGASVTIPL